MKKITMQLLADSLGLSRVTVWKVLNGRLGVSAETTKKILEAVEKLNEEESDASAGGKPPTQLPKNITLVASRADSSYFWMRILDQIVGELNQHGIAFHYLPANVMKLSAEEIEAFLSPARTDGFIAINIYNKEFIDVLKSSSLPKVFLDTIPQYGADELNGDLILLEGEKSTGQLTKNLIDKGCRRLGFIGDIQYAKTNMLRYRGFLEAMRGENLPVMEKDCLTSPMEDIEPSGYRSAILAFLNGLETLPDAFVCASDFVAFNVQSLLGNPNYDFAKFAENVQLSGYDDSKEFLLADRNVSTVRVQKGILGKRTVNQLLYRCQNPLSDYAEVSIYSKVLFR